MTVIKLAAFAGFRVVAIAGRLAAVEFGVDILEAADSTFLHLGVGAHVVLWELAVLLQKEDEHPEDSEAQDYGRCEKGCHLSNSGLMAS